MADLLLELFSEEIPARMQAPAAAQLKEAVLKGLAALGYAATEAVDYVSPRHLALIVRGLPETQADVSSERKGPRINAPQAAIDGFLRSTGLTIEQLEVRGDNYFAMIEQKGRRTAEVLPAMIEGILADFSWPKSMRWGSGTQAWVRPLHRITCLLDHVVLPVQFAGVTSGNETFGHRFLAPAAITLHHPNDYEQKLTDADVLIDAARRRIRIETLLAERAAELGLTLKDDPGLLAEVTGLVEFPSVLAGRIDAAYMHLPPEVLISEMREHQRYFALLDAESKLADRFLLVSNMDVARMDDNGAAIVAGNERVLRARLADGKFFWEQDRKIPLKDWANKLDGVVFHAKLGAMAQKVARIAALAEHLAPLVGADPGLARQAAELCKTDLPSGMVGEFPELQGVMGRYYAQAEGLPAEVADAIRDHYKPLGPNEAVPEAPVSIAVALADKLDTLAGMFAVGEKPTGSKDPFALRRAALGVIRLIRENSISFQLLSWLNEFSNSPSFYLFTFRNKDDVPSYAFSTPVAMSRYSGRNTILAAGIKPEDDEFYSAREEHDSFGFEFETKLGNDEKTSVEEELYLENEQAFQYEFVSSLLQFFHDRLKVMLKDEGVRHDAVEAVLAPEADDLLDIATRARALNAFLDSTDGANLLAGYKRAVNILRIEEKKDARAYAEAVQTTLLSQDAEQELYSSLLSLDKTLGAKLDARDYAGVMADLAALRAPVDAFFEAVMVNDPAPETRANRLNLLHCLRERMNRVAAFECIQA